MIPEGTAPNSTGIHCGRLLEKTENISAFLERLARIFEEMDRAYREVAAAYGFDCHGCAESCCLTRFYHHTFLEFFNIEAGLRDLPPAAKQTIGRRAVQAVSAYADADRTGRRPRVMCPLNEDGRCLLYGRRPMICRLHGIPNELHHPVRGVVTGPGCGVFDKAGPGPRDLRLDRTPFYSALASLERELREAMGPPPKIRLTVADLLVLIQGKQAL